MLFVLDQGWVYSLQVSIAGGEYLIRGMLSHTYRHLGLAETCQVPPTSPPPPPRPPPTHLAARLQP